MAATAPDPAAVQNLRGGCSCPRRTVITAVTAGSTAITTAAWLAGTVRSANDVSSGNPTTMPAPTTASRAH